MTGFQKRLSLGVGLLGLILLVFGAVYYYFTSDIGAQAQAVSNSRNLIIQRSQLLATLADLKNNSAQVDTYQKQISALLLTKDQLIGFSRTLDATAHADQVSMDFGFDGATVPPNGDELGYNAFHLNLQGGYGNILNFLQFLELKSPQFLVTLTDFSLGQNSGAYQLSTHGKIYFR